MAGCAPERLTPHPGASGGSPPAGPAGRWIPAVAALAVLGTILSTSPARSAAAPPCPELQVLPFERVGTDDRMDWLARGFAELMGHALGSACLGGIEPPEAPPETTLHRVGPRRPEPVSGGERGPDYVLTGSWVVEGAEVAVEAVLLRWSDERGMAAALWRGPAREVLAAPASLARAVLERLGTALDPSTLAELAHDVPRGLEAAAAFYRGLAARDAGELALARTRLLESVAAEEGFVRARREALRVTLLLGREAEAAAFAVESARRLESVDRASALEFLWEASRLPAAPPAPAPRDLLERIDRLALEHEADTGEAAAVRERLLEQIAVLGDGPAPRTGPELLARAADRWRIWTAEIEPELERRARLRGARWTQREGRWVADPVPGPTVAMWRIRALLDLARLHARAGRIEAALERYRQIVAEYAFLDETGLFGEGTGFPWTSGIRLEAHFMMLRHLKETRRLVHDRTLHPRLNEVRAGEPFVRDFAEPSPDGRARVWSRRTDGGHEYFDFVAPAGRRIDRVRVETRVSGMAWLDLDLPDPRGWPPQFSLSRRYDKRRLPRGDSRKTYDLPGGTAFLSLGVLWGPRWVRSLGEALAARRASPPGEHEIAWLRVTFETSPAGPPESGVRDRETDGKVFEHYAGKWGWEEGAVVRAAGSPSAAARSHGSEGKTWLAFESDGNLLLVGEDGSAGPALPRQINTGERESAPRLVGTHAGDFALLWRRGPRGGVAERWMASTADFAQWGAPIRVKAAVPPDGGSSGREDDASGPITPVAGGYVMLLGGGKTRFSPDLARWGPPRTTFAADGHLQTMTRTEGGRVWAVLTRADDRELAAGERPDPASGYYRTADGRTWEKRTAILVSSTGDGVSWTEPGLLHRGPEPTGLWAFPVSRGRIAVVAGYGSLDLRVIVAGAEGGAVPVASPVRMPVDGPEASFFVREGMVWCARVVQDFLAQETVVLLAGSGALLRAIEQAAR